MAFCSYTGVIGTFQDFTVHYIMTCRGNPIIHNIKTTTNETMELIRINERTVAVLFDFSYQFYVPADGVLLVTLEKTL